MNWKERVAAKMAEAYGAGRYRLAVLQDDVASEGDHSARLAICRTCDVRWRGSPKEGVEPSDFCDRPAPLKAQKGGCGCVLWAKAAVASEACPLSKWASVDPEQSASTAPRDHPQESS